MKKINIQAVKFGTVVNLSINGKLSKKTCKTSEEANTLFKAIQVARENPTEDNLKIIRCLLSEKLRIAMLAGLEVDPETNEVFLAGFNTPIPQTLVDVIEDYTKNKYPLDAIINFWKLLMINPDKRIREKLFDFIKVHDFALTDKGYMIVYKAVARKEDTEKNRFAEYISNQVFHVRKDWKCSAYKYGVYKIIATGEYGISKVETFANWNEKEKGIELLGNLGDLFDAMFGVDTMFGDNKTDENEAPVYLSKSNQAPKMEIRLGIPVIMPRSECDGDPMVECSFGLHCGSTKYIQTFASSTDAILVCLINPANVIAIPVADNSKMRVSEYFAFAVATYIDGKIDVIEQQYYENDYINYEVEELEKQILNVQAEELPIENAINAEPESRPISELKKIIETRIIDLNN
jgi:hypothetical protein